MDKPEGLAGVWKLTTIVPAVLVLFAVVVVLVMRKMERMRRDMLPSALAEIINANAMLPRSAANMFQHHELEVTKLNERETALRSLFFNKGLNHLTAVANVQERIVCAVSAELAHRDSQ
ncbi:hypothetical protein BZA05DRAFT_421405 [Tricharina praecox]|uniref:uncharacterized protein n=1 Tax=Tricharina praecox TaxID=43433 RepID=UPI00221FF2D6|nr:uncharacterized protein BZA05DRAFT_421405 [Tricharina praecox]KAI5845325.1 hypothetical protein BZA05DRAFT_421405 [Tricharina praecox]